MKDLKKDLIPVILGGALGTALRILLDIILSLVFATFSLGSTMLINAVGSFALGFLVAGLWAKPKTPRWFKVGIGPGLLGGFTTFSGVMLQALLIQNPMMTAAFLALSIATSIFAAVLGMWFGTPRKKGARR